MPSRSRCSVNRIEVYCDPIGVVDQLGGDDRVAVVVALPDRHPQRRHHQVGRFRGRRVPGHDPLRVDIHDERDIDPRR